MRGGEQGQGNGCIREKIKDGVGSECTTISFTAIWSVWSPGVLRHGMTGDWEFWP